MEKLIKIGDILGTRRAGELVAFSRRIQNNWREINASREKRKERRRSAEAQERRIRKRLTVSILARFQDLAR